ncbi:MAG: NAD(P)-dependent oxidoreductase [Bdellovibrionales bacterium]|nr:NAD(P)-dependent oxidoreductase [Bdellovibrionales bacterium]
MSEPRMMITGANGFIGKYCCQVLLDQNISVVSVGLGAPAKVNCGPSATFQHFDVDLSDENKLGSLFEKSRPTHLLHLAWFVNHGDYWESIRNLDSMSMTIRLFKQFEKFGGIRFLGVGTCAEYDWSLAGPFSETSPIGPSSFYGKVKVETCEILSFLAKRANLSFAWARLFYLFGPGEPSGKLIPSILSADSERRSISLNAKDPTLKDFIYVKDVAGALCASLLSDITGPINVGTGKGHSVEDIVALACRSLGRDPNVEWASGKPNIYCKGPLVADNSKLAKEIGFTPSFTIEKAVLDYLKHLRIS